MKILGRIDLDKITSKDIMKFKVRKPIYDFKSCSCNFGYKCDENIPDEIRIIGYEK